MVFFLAWKVVRSDFLYYIPMEGCLGVVFSFMFRLVGKIFVDFSGCLYMRHPYECGGAAFTLSMMWAQVMPFVALQFYADDEDKGSDDDDDFITNIRVFLICSLIVWLLTNISFFCAIDSSYLTTFFGFETASQFTVASFRGYTKDSQKFGLIFGCRLSFTKDIQEEVKNWVAQNIGRWMSENEFWFDIDAIDDDFLPEDILVPARILFFRSSSRGRR